MTDTVSFLMETTMSQEGKPAGIFIGKWNFFFLDAAGGRLSIYLHHFLGWINISLL